MERWRGDPIGNGLIELAGLDGLLDLLTNCPNYFTRPQYADRSLSVMHRQ